MLNKEEVKYLKKIYRGRFVKEITQMINEKYGGNHNTTEISNAKCKYGLQSGIKHQFEKGGIPHNKGKKWEEYTTPEVREKILQTTYKKGHKPANTLPIGTERYKEKYIKVKIAEPDIWEKKHILIWEEAYGKIPKGKRIMFADGNKMNVTLENLILVSADELLQLNRNGMIKEDAEMTKTCLEIIRLNKVLNAKGLQKLKKAEYNKKYIPEWRKRKGK